MPAYEFVCPSCERRDVVVRKMEHAAEPKICWTCRTDMERVYEPVAAKVKDGTPIHHDRAWVRGAGGQGNSIRRAG